MPPSKNAPYKFAAALTRASLGGLASFAAQQLLDDAKLRSRYEPGALDHWRKKLEARLVYLIAALSSARAQLFVDSVAWTRLAMESRDFPVEDLSAALLALRGVLDEQLPESAARLAVDYLDRGIEQLSQPRADLPSYIDLDAEHGKLAAEYLMRVLEGRREEAITLLTEAVDAGAKVPSLYEGIFLPTQKELGRMWLLGEINVAEEHLATATTETAMSRLVERHPSPTPSGYCVVGAAVEENHHSLGIRMITDTFAMEGWKTIYLGSNMPGPDLCESLRDHEADLLALSVTLTPQLDAATQLIRSIRKLDHSSDIPILVGGPAFAGTGELWKEMGADGVARTAAGAVELGRKLVEARRNPE